MNLMMIFSGIWTVRIHQHVPVESPEQGIFLVVIEEAPVERENSVKVTAGIKSGYLPDSSMCRDEKIMIYFRKDSLSLQIRQGDLLVIDASLRPVVNAGNPYEFDYQGYLNRKGISRSAFVESGKLKYLDSYAQSPLMNFTNKIRTSLLDIFRRAGLSGNELAVASALVLGYKADLDDMLRSAYSASGAMHVLAVSGLHVGIIYLVLNSVLSLIPFLQRIRWLKALLLLGCLWLYALITGLSPSVMRASTMFSFIVAGNAFRRKAYTYNSIAASAFLLLLLKPSNLFDVGFQLSYMAVLAIVFLHPKFYGLWSVKNRLGDKAWSLTCVSVAAQMGTAPLSLYYFHQFPNYFILTNFIVIPAASVIIYGALLLFLTAPVPILMNFLGMILNRFIYVINSSIFMIEKLPGSLLWGIRFQAWEIVCSYALMVAISAWMITKRKPYVFASLLLCLLWTGMATVRNYEDLSRQQMIVYHTPGNSMIQFINGRENNIWYKSRRESFNASVMAGNSTVAMQLDHARCIHMDSVLFRKNDTGNFSGIYSDGNFLRFSNKRLAFFTPDAPPRDAGDHSIQTDIIILTQNVNTQINKVMQTYRPDMIVMDASNSAARMNRWENDCVEAGIKYHRVDKDGAFVMDD